MNEPGGFVESILNLLRDKNYHLQKFFQMNEAETKRFAGGNFDNLEVFYQSRETILDLIRCIDELIERAANGDDATVATEPQRAEMKRLMDDKSRVVRQILAQDLDILSMIERAKSEIIRDLRAVRSSRKAVAGYRAPDVAFKLDEEV